MTSSGVIDIYQVTRASYRMAFNVGYISICKQDIHHIYTTVDLKPPATRRSPPYKPEFLEEFDRKRRERLKNRRFMEYNKTHGIELPRAPAFRTMEKSRVNGVVNRLTMSNKERFNFKFHQPHAHNDWQRANDEKKRRLKEVMKQFGGQKVERSHQSTDHEGQTINESHQSSNDEDKKMKKSQRNSEPGGKMIKKSHNGLDHEGQKVKRSHNDKGHDRKVKKSKQIVGHDNVEKLPDIN